MESAYKWKTGYFKTPADVAGAEFKRLEQTVGLTAKNVVEAARPTDSPLHKDFEWNDAVAAEKFRERQATTMIQNLVLVVNTPDETIASTRLYVNIEETTYEDVRIVMQDDDKKALLFAKAMKELESFKRKYSELEQFAELFAEIERLEEIA